MAVSPGQVVDFEAGFSRQGNIYAGDTQNNSGTANTQDSPTTVRRPTASYRENYAITPQRDLVVPVLPGSSPSTTPPQQPSGGRGWPVPSRADQRRPFVQHQQAGELSPQRQTQPSVDALFEQVLTVGAEWNKEALNDPSSLSRASWEAIACRGPRGRLAKPEKQGGDPRAVRGRQYRTAPRHHAHPGLRLDDHSDFGLNWSPSLNAPKRSANTSRSRPVSHGPSRRPTCTEQPELPALYPWQRLPDPDQQRRLLPVNNRPGRRDQRKQGTGHRVPARWLGRRGSLLPQRLQEQDRRAAGCHGTDRDQVTTSCNGAARRKRVVEGLEGNLLVPLHGT